MFVHYRSQGIVLNEKEKGEADKLLAVYTKEFGKIILLGKGVRKINSKLRSGIQSLSLSEIEFIQGKFYKTLTDAFLIDSFSALKKEPQKLKVAYRIIETLDSLLKEQEKEERLWQLLTELLKKLSEEKFSANQLPFLYYYFFWNLAEILGYRPELYGCASCRKRLMPDNLFFSVPQGGAICSACAKKALSRKESLLNIDAGAIKILRLIFRKDWETISRLEAISFSQENLKRISAQFFRFYLPKKQILNKN